MEYPFNFLWTAISSAILVRFVVRLSFDLNREAVFLNDEGALSMKHMICVCDACNCGDEGCEGDAAAVAVSKN